MGIAVALDLIRAINPKDVSGALAVVPVVNVPGWTGKLEATIAHRIAHVIFTQVVSKANFLIDLHGGDIYEYIAPCTMAYTTGKHDFDKKVIDSVRLSGIGLLYQAQHRRSRWET